MKQDLIKFFDEHRQLREIKYLHQSSANQILHKSLLPYLPIIGFNPPIQQMYEEAQLLIPRMIPHRAQYEGHCGWKSLVLHGISPEKTEGAEWYGKDPTDAAIYHWTEISELAPVTTAFFRDNFHYEGYQRVRFMLLEPGGYICPHNDVDYFLLGPINIALNNPIGCEFVMENVGVLPFEAGSILKLSLINRHAVYNNSDEPRIHMIVHGSPDFNHWNSIIEKSYHELIKDSRFKTGDRYSTIRDSATET